MRYQVTVTHSNPALCFNGEVSVETTTDGLFIAQGNGCSKAYSTAQGAIRSLFNGSMDERAVIRAVLVSPVRDLEPCIEQLVTDVTVHGFTVRSTFQPLADMLSDEQADYVMDNACIRSEDFRQAAMKEGYPVPTRLVPEPGTQLAPAVSCEYLVRGLVCRNAQNDEQCGCERVRDELLRYRTAVAEQTRRIDEHLNKQARQKKACDLLRHILQNDIAQLANTEADRVYVEMRTHYNKVRDRHFARASWGLSAAEEHQLAVEMAACETQNACSSK